MLRRISSSSTLSTLSQNACQNSSMKTDSSVGQCGVLERVCDSLEALKTREKTITCDIESPSPSVTPATASATNDADNAQHRDDESECDERTSTSYPLLLGNYHGCESDFSGTRRTGCGAKQQTITEQNIIQTTYISQYLASKQVMGISSETPRLIDDTSCSHTEVTMWYPTAGTEGVSLHDCWEEQSIETLTSLHLCDMLCGISPRIIENQPEELRTEDILRSHRRVPHTLVIDSQNPDIAPHIVITPPEDSSWDGFYTAEANRACIHSISHLVPPPLFGETGRMHSYWELMSIYYPPPPVSPMPYTMTELQSTRVPGVPLVFNHEKFRLSKRRSEKERLSPLTCNITFAVLRSLFKAIAIVASMRAASFTARYDTSGFCESMESPFEWIDPAEPLLASFTTMSRGSPIILHSLNPFSAPHIVIHEAPSNDPWITYGNAVDVQDHAFGNSLVVTASRFSQLHYINPLVDESRHTDNRPESLDEENMDYFSDASSSCSSSPTTPQTELSRIGSGFFIQLSEEKDEDIPIFLQDNDSIVDPFIAEEDVYHPISSDAVYDQEVKRKFFIDEDEEDGPPEWDDWFISAAARARDVEAESSVPPMCS